MNRLSKTAALLGTAAACAMFLTAPAAHAQKWMTSGFTQLSSGVEGGGARTTSMERAQTRFRIGADMYVDERPEDVFAAAVLIAVEPKSAFGVDLRYTRVVDNKYAFSIGGAGYFEPGLLAGPVAAAEYRMPISKNFIFTMGPEANVFFFGTDLPDKTVLWQALFQLGFRVGL